MWAMVALLLFPGLEDEQNEERFKRGVVDTDDGGDEDSDECTVVISLCSSWIICKVDEDKFELVSRLLLLVIVAARALSSCC
jgi:hypothetical protein